LQSFKYTYTQHAPTNQNQSSVPMFQHSTQICPSTVKTAAATDDLIYMTDLRWLLNLHNTFVIPIKD